MACSTVYIFRKDTPCLGISCDYYINTIFYYANVFTSFYLLL